MKFLRKFFSLTKRKEKRTKIKAQCLAVRIEKKTSVPVSVVDISMTGMGFYVADSFFEIGDAIELQFNSLGDEARVIRGTVISLYIQPPRVEQYEDYPTYRFSVQFDHSITKKYLKTLTDAFSQDILRARSTTRQTVSQFRS